MLVIFSIPVFIKYMWQLKTFLHALFIVSVVLFLHCHIQRNRHIQIKAWAREPLLKGKAQYNSPPCSVLFQSAAFYTEFFCCSTKTSYHSMEVNCTGPFPSVRVPCLSTGVCRDKVTRIKCHRTKLMSAKILS